jgi:hypothetical protein
MTGTFDCAPARERRAPRRPRAGGGRATHPAPDHAVIVERDWPLTKGGHGRPFTGREKRKRTGNIAAEAIEQGKIIAV